MADGRRTGRSDRIWQGAILTSCLVHFCVVAVGWMLISRPDNLVELKNPIRVSLIKPPLKSQPPAPAPTRKPPQPASKPQPVEPPPVTETPGQFKPPASAIKELPPSSEVKTVQPTTPKKTVVKHVENVKTKPAQKHATVNKPIPTPKVSFSRTTTAVSPPIPPSVVRSENPAEVSTEQPRSHSTSVRLSSTESVTESSAQSSVKNTASARDNYLQLLRERIDRYKKYPLMARKGHQQGVVFVEFKLSATGTLKSCQLHESCGHRLLDRAALQAVATAAPFPEVPPQIEPTEASFIVPVRFVLSR